MKTSNTLKKLYTVVSIIILIALAFCFVFPLYWIVTGAFKTPVSINSPVPDWIPKELVLDNFKKLFSRQTAPIFELGFIKGPMAPAAVRWMINTVFMAVMAMLLTCLTASMAGYALAKKRFHGRIILFTLIVCAMALPKQVILIPLIREMSALKLYNTIWAVILPTVGWPFGVFQLMVKTCPKIHGNSSYLYLNPHRLLSLCIIILRQPSYNLYLTALFYIKVIL